MGLSGTLSSSSYQPKVIISLLNIDISIVAGRTLYSSNGFLVLSCFIINVIESYIDSLKINILIIL